MDIAKQRTDKQLEVEGVWVPLDDKTTLLIARYMNDNHKAYSRAALAPYKRQMRADTLEDEVYKRLDAKGISKHVLLDWSGMTEDGKKLLYSKKEALRLLMDPELDWFIDFVRESAQDMSLFRAKEIEEAAENLGK